MPYGKNHFRLARSVRLLEALGNPQTKVPTIHIAGTKGKGSTAALLSATLTASGYRVGLFTSPHLTHLEERIAINGQPCSPEQLVQLTWAVREVVQVLDEAEDGFWATFFEILTAMGFLHFAQQEVDIAIVEVGLGGRLDSTNVCQPLITAITSISFDHMQQLGSTLSAIAREKAGILKPGIPCVSGVMAPEAAKAIAEIAEERKCPLWELGKHFTCHYHAPSKEHPQALATVDFQGRWLPAQNMETIPLGLLGGHQARNAAVAWAILKLLEEQGWAIPATAQKTGFSQVRWPARIEVVQHHPTVILDSAHNAASVRALWQTLEACFPPVKRTLVFATTKGKDVQGMLQFLLPRFDRIVLTQYLSNPRSLPVEDLHAIALEQNLSKEQIAGIECYEDPHQAWNTVMQTSSADDLICITGSLFLAAELRPSLLACRQVESA
ncbi:Bifunctional folylpolyglutamate synthase/ dihydrofolate synthase [Planctomycetales bacterium 10988]|nr:Bifunctional folylpolyglutamate synthase/ dihydrofolate synthase [Planctomycetales bacterium 10988]